MTNIENLRKYIVETEAKEEVDIPFKLSVVATYFAENGDNNPIYRKYRNQCDLETIYNIVRDLILNADSN